jgi:hypothetical protein
MVAKQGGGGGQNRNKNCKIPKVLDLILTQLTLLGIYSPFLEQFSCI